MNQGGTATCWALMLAGGLALTACSQPAAAQRSEAPTGTVDAAVQQRVKNACIADLQAHAAGKIPEPGLLHPPKVALVHLDLGDIKPVTLPGGAAGYELGMKFVYKVGTDDSRTGSKLCKINLADSSVTWQPLATAEVSSAPDGASGGS